MRRKRSPQIEALEARLCMDAGAVPPIYPGSPVLLPTSGAWTQTPFLGSPVFADLKGDGRQELIVEAAGGKMIAYATDAQGQLVKFQEYDTTPLPNGVQGNFKSTPVVVFVPGIGKVIVGALGRDEAHPTAVEDGRVYAFNAVTGQVLPGWPKNTSLPPPNTLAQSGVTGALTVGYLEGNGSPDVIVNSFSTLVTAFRISDGAKLWQFENDETAEPGAVVADLYGDGKQEVIYTSGMSGMGTTQYYPAGGYITILNQDGSLLRRIYIGESIIASPIVVDLFGDGRKEIVAAPFGYFDQLPIYTAAQKAAFRAAGNHVYAFFPDGTPVPGWPYHTTSNDALERQVWKEPVAADLFGDGKTEVMFIDNGGVLHVVGPNGQDVPGFAGGKQIGPSIHAFSSPIVADVNGDGRQDVIISNNYTIAAYNNDGSLIFSTTTPANSSSHLPNILNNAAAYGRFDPSGPPVLAFASANGDAPGRPQAVTIYQLPSSPVAPAWPMLRRDAQGRAVLLSTTGETQFVVRAYQALFRRAPVQAEIDYYVPLLTSLTLTHFDLAASLAKAAEGRGNFPGALNVSDADTTAKAQSIYNALGLGPVPADSLAAILYDAHRGRTYDDAAILIVGSNGNFAALNSVAPWARSIYRDIFNVIPTPAQTASVVRAVDGGQSMTNVVLGLLNSSDARKGYVIAQVARYLGRPAQASDFAALAYFARRENVVTAIVSSPEFFAKYGNSLPNFVNAAYQTIVGFKPDANTNASWVSQINSGKATRATLAQKLDSNAIYYNQVFVFNSLFQYIPNPATGVLPFQVGSTPTAPTNPDPNLIKFYTNQLLSGAKTQEGVLAELITSQQYVSNSTYFRGSYISYGIRM